LRAALGDERLAVAYWIDEHERWVSEDGTPASPGPAAVTVQRRGALIAALAFDGARVERGTVEAAAAEARAELENARLRAAIARQLVEVRESRARIVAAQVAERRKIERNLHDGAQQRLLALAFQLRAAEVSQSPERARATIESAVEQLQFAVRELRDLANGLHPAALSDGGLAAALDDLAARTPLPIRLDATEERFAPEVEQTAWFIVCEAVANAVKHARSRSVAISACREDGHLRLVVEDDGVGGADPAGQGLRGIADRAEAAGGRLAVGERTGGGTVVVAELPCGS
jgi:signal transduction histidine kinase